MMRTTPFTKRIPLWLWPLIFITSVLFAIQLLVVAVVVVGPGHNRNWALATKHDFDHYYRTSERVVGAAPSVYCIPFSEDERASSGIATHDIKEPTNPPLLAVVLAPLAYLPPVSAWLMYMPISLTATLLSMWFCIRRWQTALTIKEQLLLLTVVACSPPIISLVLYSQIQGFLLALCLGTVALARKHPNLSGVPLGIAIALKPSIAPLLPFLLVTGHYRIFTMSLITASLGALLPGYFDPRLGFESFLRCGVRHVTEWTTDVGNQSIFGILRNMAKFGIVPSMVAEPQRIDQALRLAGPITWIGSGVLVGALFRRNKDFEHGFLATLAMSIICAPLAWSHYYVLTWPYLIRIWRDISLGSKLLLVLSMPLIPWFVPEGSHTWSSVFSEPVATPPWVPGSICIILFLALFYSHTFRPLRRRMEAGFK